MSWWQLSITCKTLELEQTESSLLELGALSITISDAEDKPIYEPLPGTMPVWPLSIVTALFDGSCHIKGLTQLLQESLPAHLVKSLQLQKLNDQIWERAHLDSFKPVHFGNNLWIVPSWHQAPHPDAVNIQLDPGIAFGTGSHATTALCLSWLAQNPPRGLSVIDYGCGSGILAIAALKLGASSLSCVDIDQQALDATADNALRNHIDPLQINLALPSEFKSDSVDLLIANILSGPLLELASTFASLVKPGGTILLSGILSEQLNEIYQAYSPYFDLQKSRCQDDWCRINGTRLK